LFSSPHFSPSAGEGPQIRRPSTAVLIVLGGARAGTRRALTADFATLGRHPSSDLQFDPEHDSDVSARHAAVFRQGPGYVVRDLGSSNGTWLNGTRIRSDRSLEHGDRIRLGARGPEVEFVVESVEERPPAMLVTPDAPAAGPPLPGARRTPVIEQEQSTTDLKIRVEVARQTDRLRRRLFVGAGAGALLFAAAITWLAWSARQSQLALDRERDRLLARVDSVQAVLGAAAERATGLRAALDSARGEADRLRASITEQATSQDAIASLESRVDQDLARHDPLLRAARFDASAITTANNRGLVMVFVEKPGGGRVSASGFVLRVNGDTGWVVTSRHVLHDSTGLPPERVAVVFNGGKQAWRARVVDEQRAADLALLRVLAWGHVFAVREIGTEATPAAGEPVVVLGFPHGLDLQDNDWQRQGLRVSTTTGTVSAVAQDRLQIDGYGAPGASGSPVFNAGGQVIGVLFGGEPASGGRMIYAVPSSALARWIRRGAP
jgi:pSer/pThr/pTyr-binding forkhead associated (FHA) protein/S1-C subfamily serine protease